MRISEQLKGIQEVLGNWATKENGIAIIAHSRNDSWQLAAKSSKTPRCIIVYTGEDARGGNEKSILARVDRHFEVLVTRQRGGTSDRGATLTETITGGRPFFDLLDEAVDSIRSIIFEPLDEMPIDFESVQPVDSEYLDAYVISFSIGSQRGLVYTQPDSNQSSWIAGAAYPSGSVIP